MIAFKIRSVTVARWQNKFIEYSEIVESNPSRVRNGLLKLADEMGRVVVYKEVVDIEEGEAVNMHTFQEQCMKWALLVFGSKVACSLDERRLRFLEEAVELVQANGMTAEKAHEIVDYVYSRPTGEEFQEVGGVLVTLAVFCAANGIDMDNAGRNELARIHNNKERIKEKQAAKTIRGKDL